eukprot:NODE_6005_length_537_cov_76.622951_g5255_i0.p3 GENE.NODE_6005_length_537_cov_76.622951_g5255_i0~~NODE_6005_length_537_cov_76.622951_g5255_i0.p3  ORF type:complete len:60 (+),score=8.59 NODE_6005_length_537_cov_76.622951_g5255_i0:356-535(+)
MKGWCAGGVKDDGVYDGGRKVGMDGGIVGGQGDALASNGELSIYSICAGAGISPPCTLR